MGIQLQQENIKSKFFIGPEAELTPANGKKTLFVIGNQTTERIEELATLHKTPHIYFGANQSFNFSDKTNWNGQVTYFIERGYIVSIEYPSQFHNKMLETISENIWKSRLFIPVVNVRLPKLEDINHNLTLKIDDAGFARNNTGVWCLNYNQITDSNRLTVWNQYETIDVDTPNGSVKQPDPPPSFVVDEPKPPIDQSPRNSPVINNSDAGIDHSSASALKPEPSLSVSDKIDLKSAESIQAVANVYTGDVKADPIAVEGKKRNTTKKVNDAQ
jgi:hypothetical protein